jgi:hypothetical protein
MLFRTKLRGGRGVEDLVVEASTLERAERVARALCQQRSATFMLVAPLVVADESILAPSAADREGDDEPGEPAAEVDSEDPGRLSLQETRERQRKTRTAAGGVEA